MLKDTCTVDILPALGTHVPVTQSEWESMFGSIPFDRMIVHNWRNDVVQVGEVPAAFLTEVSEGLVNEAVPVEVNKRILDPSYDLILSIGQVVPHEVVGMANRNKTCWWLRRLAHDQRQPHAGRVLWHGAHHGPRSYAGAQGV